MVRSDLLLPSLNRPRVVLPGVVVPRTEASDRLQVGGTINVSLDGGSARDYTIACKTIVTLEAGGFVWFQLEPPN